MTAAAVYVRISSDSEGKGEGVARQEKDCRRLAAERGYEVTGMFIENDISASSLSTKPRPQYDEMLRRARAGEWGAIIAWKNDRLTRRIEEAAEIGAVINERKRAQNPLALLTVKSGDYEDTAVGKGMYGIQSVLNAMETDQIAERTQAAAQDRAERGRPHGRMTYGFRREGGADVVDEEQADVLREAARRVLAGEPLRSIAKDFNDRAVPTPGYLVAVRSHPRRVELARVKGDPAPPEPKPGAWDGNRLRQLLERPANAGQRVHRGEVVADGGAALWSPGQQAQLQALFRDPARRTARSTALRYQLSGLLLCGKCGSAMYGETGKEYFQKRTGRTVQRDAAYACKNSRCRGVRALVPNVDAAVEELVLERLAQADGPDLTPARTDRVAELREEIAGDRAELLNVTDDYYVHRLIDREQFKRATEGLNRKIEAAERALKTAAPNPAVGAFLATPDGQVAERWEATPVEARREVIRGLLDSVVLAPAGKGTRWSRERLQVRWSHDSTDAP